MKPFAMTLKPGLSTTVLLSLLLLGVIQNGAALLYFDLAKGGPDLLDTLKSTAWHSRPFLLPLILMGICRWHSLPYGFLLYGTVLAMILLAARIYAESLLLELDLKGFFFIGVSIWQWRIAIFGVLASALLRGILVLAGAVRYPEAPAPQ
jgi:hypothetical protein